jgi:hypothetical protein
VLASSSSSSSSSSFFFFFLPFVLDPHLFFSNIFLCLVIIILRLGYRGDDAGPAAVGQDGQLAARAGNVAAGKRLDGLKQIHHLPPSRQQEKKEEEEEEEEEKRKQEEEEGWGEEEKERIKLL